MSAHDSRVLPRARRARLKLAGPDHRLRGGALNSTEEVADDDTSVSDSAKPAAKPAKQDGRKKRWHEHKIARREELVDGTIAAIRARGSNLGMDEIAGEIGVSKTVLYRYFADKSDLTNATMRRFVETILAPRIYLAIGSQVEEYDLVHSAIAAYVETVAADPELYLYVMNNTSVNTNNDVVADSERMFAEVVATVLGERMRQWQMDSGGSVPWAYSIVGGIQLATHWWISNKSMSAEDLIDYLTMMTWSAVEGVARAGGSPSRFKARPHPIPAVED
ncbi:TetR/AcrR family transcriptional regulator [Antrihabitans cavernicola]|uniref:TetR/AcrR family transcriptional regulator n=1 Tax=Antrihabitans cavernicola TaxID=2495913 RepID=A0A5A7SCT2_9NOCA|nr:TetR/AcrR family transcriptional regulator [Spelaeibacter cavernicola]KAA0022305.1 TetR/AcrR family transcriptional regulator [Spelaeibacter cavernicola]